MATPHISALPGDIAEAVLLPGDPLRASFIAETFFQDAKPVTNVRNMAGYTGTWNGMPVSVMGTGMGVPSASIYITELIRFYGVKRLIRVGSTGAVPDHVGFEPVDARRTARPVLELHAAGARPRQLHPALAPGDLVALEQPGEEPERRRQ